MIERIISGGQSGEDQAALRVALSAGIPAGGTALCLLLTKVEHLSIGGKTRLWRP